MKSSFSICSSVVSSILMSFICFRLISAPISPVPKDIVVLIMEMTSAVNAQEVATDRIVIKCHERWVMIYALGSLRLLSISVSLSRTLSLWKWLPAKAKRFPVRQIGVGSLGSMRVCVCMCVDLCVCVCVRGSRRCITKSPKYPQFADNRLPSHRLEYMYVRTYICIYTYIYIHISCI